MKILFTENLIRFESGFDEKLPFCIQTAQRNAENYLKAQRKLFDVVFLRKLTKQRGRKSVTDGKELSLYTQHHREKSVEICVGDFQQVSV